MNRRAETNIYVPTSAYEVRRIREVREQFKESVSLENTDTWLAVKLASERGIVSNKKTGIKQLSRMYATLYPFPGEEVHLDDLDLKTYSQKQRLPLKTVEGVAQVLFDARLAHSPKRAEQARKRLSRGY